MAVSENYTSLSRKAKQETCNEAAIPYAQLMGFKERLRQARDAKKLTGDALGRQLAVSKQTISHWEAGRYEPSIEQIKALCAILDVSADWLLEQGQRSLSPEALTEAAIYEALSPDDRRKWRAMRMAMFGVVVGVTPAPIRSP